MTTRKDTQTERERFQLTELLCSDLICSGDSTLSPPKNYPDPAIFIPPFPNIPPSFSNLFFFPTLFFPYILFSRHLFIPPITFKVLARKEKKERAAGLIFCRMLLCGKVLYQLLTKWRMVHSHFTCTLRAAAFVLPMTCPPPTLPAFLNLPPPSSLSAFSPRHVTFLNQDLLQRRLNSCFLHRPKMRPSHVSCGVQLFFYGCIFKGGRDLGGERCTFPPANAPPLPSSLALGIHTASTQQCACQHLPVLQSARLLDIASGSCSSLVLIDRFIPVWWLHHKDISTRK